MSNIDDVFYNTIKGTEDFVSVVDIDNGGGYDWDEFHGWYSPSRRAYFWVSGSGCSCNSISDDYLSLEDFGNGTSKAALESALRSYCENSYSTSATEALDAVRAVKTFRPGKAVSA